MKNDDMQAAKGWFDTIKDSIQQFLKQFELSWQQASEWGVAFVLGLIAGFLTNRYGKQVLFLLVLFVVALISLEYFNIIFIDWQALRDSFGFKASDTLDKFMQQLLAWIRMHIIVVIIGIVGFLIGYKI